jgi:hypothetical protein
MNDMSFLRRTTMLVGCLSIAAGLAACGGPDRVTRTTTTTEQSAVAAPPTVPSPGTTTTTTTIRKETDQ